MKIGWVERLAGVEVDVKPCVIRHMDSYRTIADMPAAPPTNRTILHVDMDAFFASVEQLDHPQWRGKPLLVGHDGPRGVVAAASYEARKFGCHSAQPIAIAKQRCPQAIITRGRGKRYREVSLQVFELFHDATPLVQPLSIDEAFLDVTGSSRLLGDGVTIAKSLREQIFKRMGVTASVGVAPNKFVAKLASDMDKPDGLTVAPFEPDALKEWLAPLPIELMWGVGGATKRKLNQFGIYTFADMAVLEDDVTARLLGKEGSRFSQLSKGIDDRPVTPDRQAKSIGHEQTFEQDIDDAAAVRTILLGLVEQVARRLRAHEFKARTVSLKIRFGDFETISRSTTFKTATNITSEIWQAAKSLFDQWERSGFKPVRLIGVSTSQFHHTGGQDGEHSGDQLSLFSDPKQEKQQAIDRATDAIAQKYGKKAIGRLGS